MVSFEMFDSPMDMTETARTFGVPPTSLETFIHRAYEAPATAPQPVELAGSARR